MRNLLAAFLLVCVPEITSADFSCRLDMELTNVEGFVPPEIKKEIARRHYVFVAGFLNETMPGYFKDNAKALKEMGATRVSVFMV